MKPTIFSSLFLILLSSASLASTPWSPSNQLEAGWLDDAQFSTIAQQIFANDQSEADRIEDVLLLTDFQSEAGWLDGAQFSTIAQQIFANDQSESDRIEDVLLLTDFQSEASWLEGAQLPTAA